MNKRNLALILTAVVLLAAIIAAATLAARPDRPAASSAEPAANAVTSAAPPVSTSAAAPQADPAACDIQLAADSIAVSGDGAVASGNTVTITQAGRFTVSGTLPDGQIIVDAAKEDEVYLILSGADISCSDSAPIWIKRANHVYLELVEGTENAVSDTANYVFAQGEDEPDAAVFAKDDLVIQGTGSLTVTGNYGAAIHGKDNLTIAGGDITVVSAGDGVKGKDSVTVSGGTLDITAGEDGIQSNNDKDGDRGNVVIQGDSTITIRAEGGGVKAETMLAVQGGTLDVTAGGDGLHGAYTLQITGGTVAIDAAEDAVQGGGDVTVSDGTLTIVTAGGADEAPEHAGDFGPPGWFNNSSDAETASAKGVKAGGDILLSGCTIDMDVYDDAFHCGGNLTVTGDAHITLRTGDDAFHAGDTLNIEGGYIDIAKSYEGYEAMKINISGGETHLTASDDGMNAAGGSDGWDNDMMFMEGQAETLEEADYYVHITGGVLYMDAAGDGLDSNGALFVDGGEVYLMGPSDSMNGALDYTTTGQINGGTVVAAGASGMAQNFDRSSTQPSMMYTFSSSIPAGSRVTLTDSKGAVLVDYEMSRQFNNVVISNPALTVGETYTLTCGDETVEVEMTDVITSLGSRGGFGFGPGGGGPGGGPGGPPGF